MFVQASVKQHNLLTLAYASCSAIPARVSASLTISNTKLNPFFSSLDLELSGAKKINCEVNSDELNIKNEPAGYRGSVMGREQLFTIAFHFAA